MKTFLLSLPAVMGAAFLLPAQPYNLTFRVDMSAETVSAGGVHVAGNFQSEAGFGNDWDPSTTPLTDGDGDQIYELTVSVPAGAYEYKFVNGDAWGMDENPPGECSVGGTNNRIVTVGGEDVVLPVVPFNACTARLRLAVNMSGVDVAPEGVHVMGDFQQAAGFPENWDPSSITLTDPNADGTYEVELALPPGDYQFLFVNGHTPDAAEVLPADCTVPGGNGSQNRSYTFSGDTDTAPVFCFNTCTACHPAVVFDYDTHWWNDAVFYEIFVRSFYDSDSDGIGDFPGLTEKLDYLNDGDPNTDDDLGVTGIWLMPMMPSPSYHGYDVTDYYGVEEDYGTMEDFENFLDAAHARGIKVIIDFVMNHSSSQHPWFLQSVNGTGDYRDWYIWSETNPGYLGPWGQTVWHPRSGDYFYGLFWDGMPDLNYEHPPVKAEMFDVTNFWLDKGVDGFRLDAIKYLVEDNGLLENTDGTFAVLEEFNEVYKNANPEAFTVGEAWSNTASVAPYVQNNRLDACFEFTLAGDILTAVNTGQLGNLESQLLTVLESYPALQYATFLTNHDIDRVFSTLGASAEKMKLAAAIYLTLPGVPFVYYGEEIGMIGTGAHPNIRRPMQWTDGLHAGFSAAAPWNGIGSNFSSQNVASLADDPQSLLWHYRRLIHIRNEQAALRRGRTVQLLHDAPAAFGFARVHAEEAVLVLANLSTAGHNPLLSLPQSALPPGEYYVTELLSREALGSVTIDANGGFAQWQASGHSLAGRETWLLLLSTDNPINATSEITPATDFKLQPNPTNGLVQLELGDTLGGEVTVRVFSATGQLLRSVAARRGRLTLDTHGWPAGLYLVHVSTGGRPLVKKLVVN